MKWRWLCGLGGGDELVGIGNIQKPRLECSKMLKKDGCCRICPVFQCEWVWVLTIYNLMSRLDEYDMMWDSVHDFKSVVAISDHCIDRW